MTEQPTDATTRGLSVSAKISLGFSIVLALHISIALLGHYGLGKAQNDLRTYDSLRRQVENIGEIDLLVGSLQRNVLLFAFTGYQGPETRATEIQDELERLLQEADNIAEITDREAIDEMHKHLAAHREIFEAVAVDRAKRRKLVNEELVQCGRDFDQGIAILTNAPRLENAAASIDAAFRAAQLNTMQFINDPDSQHVRNAKDNLANTIQQLEALDRSADPETRQIVLRTITAANNYEAALIQMVQATRGYLHLVNVVLAGELKEFRRLATDMRMHLSDHVRELATTMADDNRRFQYSSNVFSVITIVLGILAAWFIGRDVAPPLNAIAGTFDGLAAGRSCDTIPGMGRPDELGRLAVAAQVFKDKAAETERLLRIAESSQEELNELNQELAAQTALAETMANEATAATRAKSEFLANMSHEIRTPMTAILGFAETIAENVDDPENTVAIETIQRNGEHLLAIINDILDLSKVEAGKMTVECVPYSPFDLIDEVASLVKVKADGAGLELITEFDGPIPATVMTDPTRIRQILINVLGNAIKFTEVGSVRVTTRFVPDAGCPLLHIDVSDTGIGMTPIQVERLFQPFSQADASTTRQFGGTGLGLTVSKRLATMLGGDLTLVETCENTGSRFRLTVATGPCEEVEMISTRPTDRGKESDTTTTPLQTSLEGFRILLAEDGPDNQRLLTFVLQKAGAEVELAENGQLALEAATEARTAGNPFDCVLMDMQMPVMDGYQATCALRKLNYDGPIIALTAHAMHGDESKCLAAGCDDYLTKPIDRVVFIDTVSRWCQQARSVQHAG